MASFEKNIGDKHSHLALLYLAHHSCAKEELLAGHHLLTCNVHKFLFRSRHQCLGEAVSKL